MQLTELSLACEQFYGLKKPAFSLTPDTEFYVDLPSQKAAFDILVYALSGGEGFIKISGEVGTGKTLLCRRLLNRLSEQQIPTAYIPNPDLTPSALWRVIARELQIDDQPLPDSQVQYCVQQALLTMAADGKTLVLLIDEAQCMPRDTMEALRLISNLETERQKLIQIVLFGQPELDTLLQNISLRQLRQRITYSARLEPLNNSESLSVYLQQRLSAAGYRGMPLFQPGALKALWRASQGIPRLVNILAAKTLLAGYGSGCHSLGYQHVMRAVADTESSFYQTAPLASEWHSAVPYHWYGITLTACLLLVML
ncbi:MAG: AAA family ATPase [Oceanospirillaceae bacterium]|nr:AAA family ATPase [Oceanospirillaceae bacterium]MBT12928.1 AAA family ATPase [Oceanospirillaceae bacterium]|tara:strand:+ start:30052 stop:30987 length:936 start_codon:yes stop_codon:yes gene_type:complete